jgi:hypothetical protein
MLKQLVGVAFVGLVLAGTPAEARRLLWWQQDAPSSDVYSDIPDDQNAYAQDQFNQEQYDLYMQQMHHKKRAVPQYDQSYYDPQVAPQVYKPRVVKPKKKVVTQAVVPESVIPAPPVKKPVVVQAPAVVQTPQKPVTGQVASIGKRFQTDAPASSAKPIDCGKGATIVSGYGFSTVTNKTCSGATYVYGATRGGNNFEIQVSSATGELTAVKKL